MGEEKKKKRTYNVITYIKIKKWKKKYIFHWYDAFKKKYFR